MAWDRRTSVLVIEDDSGLCDLYRQILTVAGFAVTAVEDGLDALRRIDVTRPDALVLDLVLPHVSGWDVQRELASRPDTRHIPIVVVTGTDANDVKCADFACVLRRPIVPSELVSAVDNSLRRAHRAHSFL